MTERKDTLRKTKKRTGALGLSPWVVGVIIVLAWAPLPFGSVTPIWKNVLSALCLTLFAAFLLVRGWKLTWPPHGNSVIAWSALFFGCVCIWIFLQAMPFTPIEWHHPAWTIAGDAIGQELNGAVSMDPGATMEDLISLLSLAAIFGIVVIEARDPHKAKALLAAVAVIALGYAVYGLVIYLTGNESVAWVEKRHYTDSLSGTFVNRNTYGVFAGLGVLAATALLISRLGPIAASHTRRNEKLRQTVAYLTGIGGLWIVAILIGGSALILSGSRAANTASALGLLTLLLAYLGARKISTAMITIGVFLTAGIAFLVFILSGDLLFDRFGRVEENWESRNAIYEIVYLAIADHIWLGAGYGAFDDVYRIYANVDQDLGVNIQAAHSVYLEMVLEIGTPAALVFFVGLASLVVQCLVGVFVRRRDRIVPATAVATSVLVGVQGAVDFGIQTPAIAVLYASFLGMGVAQATSSQRLGSLRP